jgi:predicted ATPase
VKIKSLKIDNFKTLLNFELIEPNPFSVFVGANGVGKSNIFEALEYLNFNCFDRTSNTDELFGGHKNILNYNSNKISLRLILESLDSGRLYFEMIPAKIEDAVFFEVRDSHDSHDDLSLPKSEFESQFYDTFSRIFPTSKEANKLNLSNSDKKLNFNCDNLENVLRRVLENPLKALEIKEWLNLLRPGFSDIKIEKDISEKSFIQFYEEGYEKPFGKNLISDGTYNILCLLTAIYQTDEPQFLCIEEPENGLNPYVVKELVNFFREQCKEKGHYIWLNTHSQTLVNQLQPEEIIIINKENGITVPKQIKDKNMHGLPMDEAWLTNVLGGGVPW